MKNKIAALALIMSGLCSCHENSGKLADNSSATISSLGVNDSLVMRYVTCSKSMIDTLIAQGDSVFTKTDKYSIENLALYNEEYNKWLVASYGDTIPVIVSIYDTYDRITGYNEGKDNNASFIWHEVAKMQLTRFLRKDDHEVTREDIDKVFRIIDDILDTYLGGSQYEMNVAAARRVLIADYYLLDAYKHLMDSYPSDEIKKLVHADYKYMLDTCQKYIEYRYEQDRYSDLPRELEFVFYDALMAKTASINKMTAIKVSNQAVVKNLNEHYCLKDGKSFKFTQDVLYEYFGDD